MSDWVKIPEHGERRFYCRVHECIHAASELTAECEHVRLDELKVILDAPPVDALREMLWALVVFHENEMGLGILERASSPAFTPEAAMKGVVDALDYCGGVDLDTVRSIAKWLTAGREGWS